MVYEGKPEDMYIAAGHDHTPGYERDFVIRTLAFYNDELYLRGKDGSLTKIDAPNSAQKGVHKRLADAGTARALEVGGKTYKAGSLLVTNFDDVHGRQARVRRAVRAHRQHLVGRLHLDQEPPRPQRDGRRQEQAVRC